MPVESLVNAAGPTLPTAKNALLRVTVAVSGQWGRSVTIALGELDSSFGNHPAYLAVYENGRPLPAPELVVPEDTFPARTLGDVNRITVGVQNPTPTTPPAGAVAIEGTGLDTWVAAVGSDGYVATVTPAEAWVGGRPLLISLNEDGTPLAQPRLVERDGLPADAPDSASANSYVEPAPRTATPDTPMSEAIKLFEARDEPRLVVVDEDGVTLRGLLCGNATGTGFCTH